MALKWLRENLSSDKDTGYVYFMDDDNTYNVNVFREVSEFLCFHEQKSGTASCHN